MILEKTIAFCEKNRRFPTQQDLDALGITRAKVRTEFGGLESLKRLVLEATDSIFDFAYVLNSRAPLTSTKRFVITTAVTGAFVNKRFLQGIKTYCNKYNAELVVMVAHDTTGTGIPLDPILRNEIIISSDFMLNENVTLLGIKSAAQASDPITGLPRVGRRNGTFISASPKQRLRMVPTGQHKLPHALMSTGAITDPLYKKTATFFNKRAYLADLDHVMGAVILEIEDNKTFHFRQIQMDKTGGFVDLGTYVKGTSISNMQPAAMVLGDWHSGDTDPLAAACWEDLSDTLKVKSWVIHDGFDGASVNHHNLGKLTTLAKQAEKGKLSLKDELTGFVSDLQHMLRKRDVVVVKSNHDEFLERYLNEGRYVEHPYNHRIALELAAAFLDGINPLKFYFDKTVKRTKNKLTWLDRDESFKVAGIELGAHGDKGANGARGSALSMENAYGPSVSGHTHSPAINRDTWVVGTTSRLQLDYNVGPSSWFHTSCLVYPNGSRQLVNCIDGKVTTRKF